MNPSDITRLRELAGKATPGPWCIESVGEKGDGSNMIGVAFGPDDANAECPLSGWLRPFDDAGNEVDYCIDELVCVVDHSERLHNENATYIAACDPQTIISLCDRIKVLEDALKELADVRDGDDPLGWVEATARAALDGTP